jgi:hypothetical protein
MSIWSGSLVFRRQNRELFMKLSRTARFFHLRYSSTAQNSADVIQVKNGAGVKLFEDIPGPPKLPIIGSMIGFFLQLRKKPLAKIMLDYQFDYVKKYGRIHKIDSPGFAGLQAFSPRI